MNKPCLFEVNVLELFALSCEIGGGHTARLRRQRKQALLSALALRALRHLPLGGNVNRLSLSKDTHLASARIALEKLPPASRAPSFPKEGRGGY